MFSTVNVIMYAERVALPTERLAIFVKQFFKEKKEAFVSILIFHIFLNVSFFKPLRYVAINFFFFYVKKN